LFTYYHEFSLQERIVRRKTAADSGSSGSQVLTSTSLDSSHLKTDESDLNIEQENDTLIDDYIKELDSDLKKK
jgi:hypothetical protein